MRPLVLPEALERRLAYIEERLDRIDDAPAAGGTTSPAQRPRQTPNMRPPAMTGDPV